MAPNTTEMVSIENRDPGDEDVIQAEKDRMNAVWAGLRTAIVEDSEYIKCPMVPLADHDYLGSGLIPYFPDFDKGMFILSKDDIASVQFTALGL